MPSPQTVFQIQGSPVQPDGGVTDLKLSISTDEVRSELWGSWGTTTRLKEIFASELRSASEVVDQFDQIAVLEWIRTHGRECQGAGSALLERFLDLARSSGVKVVFARFYGDEAEAASINVMDWYEKRGFHRVPGTGVGDPLLVKPL